MFSCNFIYAFDKDFFQPWVWLLMSWEPVFHQGMAGMFWICGIMEEARLTVSNLCLEWMILRILSNLSDSVVATLGWVCLIWMRNQCRNGLMGHSSSGASLGKPGLPCGLPSWAAPSDAPASLWLGGTHWSLIRVLLHGNEPL